MLVLRIVRLPRCHILVYEFLSRHHGLGRYLKSILVWLLLHQIQRFLDRPLDPPLPKIFLIVIMIMAGGHLSDLMLEPLIVVLLLAPVLESGGVEDSGVICVEIIFVDWPCGLVSFAEL